MSDIFTEPFSSTDLGSYYLGDCQKVIPALGIKNVNLIFTSPPFPLNCKKKYDNKIGEEYRKWFTGLAETFSDILAPDGSIVIEMGNAWEPNRPVQTLLNMTSLLGFVQNEKAGLRLCQEFICYNPARLPSPAQWVTVNRIRATDAYTRLWWMAKSDNPKADNKRILRPYSKSMRTLLKRQRYNAGKRPSEHVISETSFLKDNKGSISHNVLELEQSDPTREFRPPYSMLSISNTSSADYFTKKCREKNIVPHPARMPLELATFFIEFLTDEGDTVLDPFGGSNTTGFCAERLNRRWITIEQKQEYAEQAKLRFTDPELHQATPETEANIR